MSDSARRKMFKHLLGAAALMTARRGLAEPPATPDPLLWRAHELLEALHSPTLTPFLAAWPSATERRHSEASSVPVVSRLPAMADIAPAFSAPLLAALVRAAPTLAWRRSYSLATVGAHFDENYGWTEFAGLLGPVRSRHLACGVLLLGPHVTYPPHRHEADEIYVPLVGTAQWRHGNAPWRKESPGAVIHHAPHVPHAMRTDSEALLGLYLWRSANLAQSSHFDHPLIGAPATE